MPRGCDYAVTVEIDVAKPLKRVFGGQPRTGVRKFIVEYDADGNPLRIKERKLMFRGEPWERIINVSYWKAGTHTLGIGDTLAKRILAAALAKTTAQERSINATP